MHFSQNFPGDFQQIVLLPVFAGKIDLPSRWIPESMRIEKTFPHLTQIHLLGPGPRPVQAHPQGQRRALSPIAKSRAGRRIVDKDRLVLDL